MPRPRSLLPLALALLLAGCNTATPAPRSATPPVPLLNGFYGGVLHYGEYFWYLLGVEVATDAAHAIRGDGVFTTDGSDLVYLTVAGRAAPGSVELVLSDAYGQSVHLRGTMGADGVVRGHFTTTLDEHRGAFRLTHESNFEALRWSPTARGHGLLRATGMRARP